MTFTTSVVICAYTERRWTQLLDAVTSVRAQRDPVQEIVVVVDHNDALLTRCRSTLSGVDVVANQGPRGLSGARNTGIARCHGDVVAFLDDDAAAEPDWTQQLLASFADQRVLGVGGSADPLWESPEPRWWPAEFGWVVGCSYRGQPTETAPVRNLMGCNMAIRRSVLEAVGGFDAGLGRTADRPLGCEETELCIRAAELNPGGRFVHEPRARVRHVVPAARASWTYFRERCRAEGVSKAWVADRVGRGRALASERSYVSRVLPSGVLRNLGAVARGDLAGAARAGAIVAGLAHTTASYLRTRWDRRDRREAAGRSGRPDRSDRSAGDPAVLRTEPVLPLVVDLAEAADDVALRTAAVASASYRRAVCLVTEDGDPIAKVVLELAGAEADREIVARLRRDLDRRPTAQSPATPRLGASAAVVVATRDRPELLRECLDSLFAGTLQPTQVIVVDNAPSDDRTKIIVEALARTDARLTYVREPRPGLARAHNAALPHLDAPLVAFTDDDVIVDRRWLERMTLAFDDSDSGAEGSGPEVVCVTGLIAPRELETLPQQWIEGNTTYDKGLHRRVFDRAHRPADPLFPYTSGSFGSGANMAFRTSYLRAHRGFDAALGTGTFAMGGDDLAAFYDVVAGGHRLVYEPAAIVLHRHHRHYAGLRRQTYGYGAGLGAHLMRCLLRDPRMALVLLRHAVAAGRRATEIVAPPAVGGLPPYPADLSRAQLRGLVSGPIRYLISRAQLERVA